MRRSRSGFVYLLALLVVLVTASIAVVMASGAGLRLHAGDADLARAQCRAAGLGVLRAVMNDLTVSQAGGGLPCLVTVSAAGERVGRCEVVLLGRDPAAAAAMFGLIPAGARLNVNSASIEQMAALPGMTTAIAAAIADWRDVDDVPEKDGGAERSDTAYHAAAVPYAPRNAPLETLDELRLVRGVTDTLWFGEDVNRNGLLDTGEDANGDGHLTAGLRDCFALDTREPSLAPDGSARTEINPPFPNRPNPMIRLFTALLGQDRSAELTQLAQGQRFANRLEAIAALELTDDEAAKLWPYLREPQGRVGLVDAWAAREEVLMAVVGADVAKTIVSARPATAPSGPGWLATALGRAGAAAYGGLLTSGSYQFIADILAIREDGAGWTRLAVSIDCSVAGAPRVAGIRPAEQDGWPLPWATPDMLRRHPGSHDLAAFLANGQL